MAEIVYVSPARMKSGAGHAADEGEGLAVRTTTAVVGNTVALGTGRLGITRVGGLDDGATARAVALGELLLLLGARVTTGEIENTTSAD